MDLISQVWIGVFGLSAIWMVNRPEDILRKWAPIVGFAAGPGWYFTVWYHEQWGIMLLNFFYSYSWLMGIYYQWIKPKRALDRVTEIGA